MNYIDLFAGAGGMSLGFEKAGFENIYSIEYDPKIAETYKYNFPNNKLIINDITKISDELISENTENKDIDVIVGGPPCQGFSMAGNIGRTFIADPRNYLFKEFVRVVSIVQPKMFIMENVARLTSHRKGQTITEIVDEFKKLGYSVQYKVLQAAFYGVPQYRSRVFVVGTSNSRFNYPKENKQLTSIKEAIDDLPELKSGKKSNVPNHFAMNHTKQMLEKMSYVKDGGDRKDIPKHLRPKSGDARKYVRYNSMKPSFTVTGDMRKVFHYEQNRALTPRELARLQSFPDEFVFIGTSINIQQQIGNAVPPKLAFAVAEEVKRSLGNEF